MKVIGLTGNMGCGKSTVAKMLALLSGVYVLDSDSIAKAILGDLKNRRTVEKILNRTVFNNEIIQYGEVAKIIFSDKERKHKLEKFIHPLVWQKICEEINTLPLDALCIVESAILFESGWQDRFAKIITVTCKPEEQLRRLKNNRKMKEEEIKKRLDGQMSSSEKEKLSDFVLNTDCPLSELELLVGELYRKLREVRI